MSLWGRILRFLFGRWLKEAADEEFPHENGDGEPVHWIDGGRIDE